MQGIERFPLYLSKRREEGRSRRGWRASDTRSRAIDKGPAGGMMRKDDRSLIESLVGRSAWKVSDQPCLRSLV